jgi:DNA-binding phage protein
VPEPPRMVRQHPQLGSKMSEAMRAVPARGGLTATALSRYSTSPMRTTVGRFARQEAVQRLMEAVEQVMRELAAMPKKAPPPTPSPLVIQLRQAAREARLPYWTIARASGVAITTVTRVLEGKVVPSLTTLEAIADHLGFSLHLKKVGSPKASRLTSPGNRADKSGGDPAGEPMT